MSSHTWAPNTIIRHDRVDSLVGSSPLGGSKYVSRAYEITSTCPNDLLRVDAVDKKSLLLAVLFAGIRLAEDGAAGPPQALVTVIDDTVKPVPIELKDIRAANFADLTPEQQQQVWQTLDAYGISGAMYHGPNGDYRKLSALPDAGNICIAAIRAWRAAEQASKPDSLPVAR